MRLWNFFRFRLRMKIQEQNSSLVMCGDQFESPFRGVSFILRHSSFPAFPLALTIKWNLCHPSFSQHLHEQNILGWKLCITFWFYLSLFHTASKILSQSGESHDRQPMEWPSVTRKYELYGVDAFDLSFSPASIQWRLHSPSAHLAL